MATVLARIRSEGINLRLVGGGLQARGQMTDVQHDWLRRHKAELIDELRAERRRRRDEVLMLLADNPGVRYAYVTDADSDPIVLAVAICDLATFEMTIPADRYDPFRLMEIIDTGRNPDHV